MELIDAFFYFYIHIIICIALSMVIHVKSHSFEHYDLDSPVVAEQDNRAAGGSSWAGQQGDASSGVGQ